VPGYPWLLNGRRPVPAEAAMMGQAGSEGASISRRRCAIGLSGTGAATVVGGSAATPDTQSEPSLRDKLTAAFVEALEADWQQARHLDDPAAARERSQGLCRDRRASHRPGRTAADEGRLLVLPAPSSGSGCCADGLRCPWRALWVSFLLWGWC